MKDIYLPFKSGSFPLKKNLIPVTIFLTFWGVILSGILFYRPLFSAVNNLDIIVYHPSWIFNFIFCGFIVFAV